MSAPEERPRTGLAYLESATALLQRIRSAHPTLGLYEAGDVQWWWRVARPTDRLPQLFWFDEHDRPVAAAVLTHWGEGTSAVLDGVALAPMVLPDATPDWATHVVERGLAHAADLGVAELELEVDRTDEVVRSRLFDAGFAIAEDGVVESWLASGGRPVVSPLADGYRLASRQDTAGRAHHLAERNGPQVEDRLRQASLYRPDLDLVVIGDQDDVAAYGLFWYDPATATGLVEPMRTQDGHQRRGLARHVLTAGVARLVEAGAERVKICFEPGNAASSHLYLSVGFEPVKQTDLFAGRTDGARR